MSLSGKIAVITGAATGFGKAFSQAMLQRGGKVVIADIDINGGRSFQQECEREFGEGRAVFTRCDVTHAEGIKYSLELAKSTFGGLDIVCNNAGIFPMERTQGRAAVAINLMSVIEGSYMAMDMMDKRKGGEGGVIVNVASMAGIGLMPESPIYTATKHGVVAFTRCFENQLNKEDGIRMNVLCPWFCKTNLVLNAIEKVPVLEKKLDKQGVCDLEDVVTAFLSQVEDESKHGVCTSILPNNIIRDLPSNLPSV